MTIEEIEELLEDLTTAELELLGEAIDKEFRMRDPEDDLYGTECSYVPGQHFCMHNWWRPRCLTSEPGRRKWFGEGAVSAASPHHWSWSSW
jgi:hypothetical protein